MRQVAWLLGGLAFAIVIAALCRPAPMQAQSGDPWGTLATIETLATRSALDASGSAAGAQGQAAQAEAAAAAARARAVQQAAAATQQAADYANAQAQAAQATRDAIDAQATRAAYEMAFEDSKRRSDFGVFLLYLAGTLAMIVALGFVVTWTRRLMSRSQMPTVDPRDCTEVEQLPRGTATYQPTEQAAPIIIDAVPIGGAAPAAETLFPALPAPGDRGINRVTVIDAPGAADLLREYIARYGIGADDPQDDGNRE